MFEVVWTDLNRYRMVARSRQSVVATVATLRYHGARAVVAYRLRRWLRDRLGWVAWPLYAVLGAFVRVAYGIDIHLSAEIGPGFYIGHFGGIRLTQCRIGSNCSISQSVKIGPAGDGQRGPTLQDRVWVGAHARIESDCVVGEGATVGAGAVVAGNVPAYALVLGDPARVVQRQYDNSRILVLPAPDLGGVASASIPDPTGTPGKGG